MPCLVPCRSHLICHAPATPGTYIAGVDEAGRGPLAGPVFAAAVILPQGHVIDGVRDSKKCSARHREALYPVIRSQAVCVSAAAVSPAVIDRINILQATMKAMALAVGRLAVCPQYVLVDGNRLPTVNVPAQAMTGGDGYCQSIAAASIIAKVLRDRYMRTADNYFPGYGFAVHKGYPTAAHRQAIDRLGPSSIHRFSFRGVREKLPDPMNEDLDPRIKHRLMEQVF